MSARTKWNDRRQAGSPGRGDLRRPDHDSAYHTAFIALSALLVVPVIGMLMWLLFVAGDDPVDFAIGLDGAAGLTWLAIGVALSLPSMVIAWTEAAV